jgi:hypothetical protein
LGQEIQSPNCTHCFDRILSAVAIAAATAPFVPFAHPTKPPNVIGQEILIATVQPIPLDDVFQAADGLIQGFPVEVSAFPVALEFGDPLAHAAESPPRVFGEVIHVPLGAFQVRPNPIQGFAAIRAIPVVTVAWGLRLGYAGNHE